MMSVIFKFALIASACMSANATHPKGRTNHHVKCNDPVKGFNPEYCEGHPVPEAFNENAKCRGTTCLAAHCCKWGGACMDGPCFENCDENYDCKLGYYQ